MSGAAADVSCVIFHDECPGLSATLCGGELFVVVVARTEGCVLFTSRCRVHVGVTNMGGGIDAADTSPTSLIVNFVVLHYCRRNRTEHKGIRKH
jgi:hypothetical protein